VDHVELLSRIPAREGQDRELAARVIREELGDVEHLAVDDHPAVGFGVVLGNLCHGDATSSTATAASLCHFATMAAAAATDPADDRIGCILPDDIRRVDHVELLSRIPAREGQDRELAARVIREELGDVEHLAVDDHPTIGLGSVLGDLLQGIATTTTTAHNCRTSLSASTTRLVHAVLIGASRELGALHSSSETSAREIGQRDVLHVCTQDVLGAMLAGNTSEDDAIQQGVPAQTVVAVHTASDLASGVETGDGLATRVHDRGVHVDLQTTHAIVDHGRDDRDVEGLALERGARDDVVVELLAGARLARGLIPRLARGVGVPAAAIGVLLGLLCGLVVLLVGLLHHGDRHTHVRGKVGAALVVLHDATASVMLAVPDDLVRRSLVQGQAERRLALPHLSGDVVTPAELVGEALAVGIEDEAADTAERLSGEELDFGIRVVRLHEASRVNLHPLQVDALGADILAHFDAITCAVLAVGGGQVHQVRAVLREEGVLGEVRAEAARGEDHRAVLLEVKAALLVDEAHADARAVHQQLVRAGLGGDARLVGALSDLLDHLDQGIGYGHAREALGATVRAGHGVTAEARDEGQVQVELLDEPIDVETAVAAEHLDELRLLGTALQRVVGENRDGVVDALGLLGLRLRAVDAARRLRGVSSAERGLVNEHDPASALENLIRSRHAAQATADNDGLI